MKSVFVRSARQNLTVISRHLSLVCTKVQPSLKHILKDRPNDGDHLRSRSLARTFATTLPVSKRVQKSKLAISEISRDERTPAITRDVEAAEDFFGFYDESTSADHGAHGQQHGHEHSTSADLDDQVGGLQPVDPLEKYGNLDVRQRTTTQESIYFTTYGVVRFDNDNVPNVFEENEQEDEPTEANSRAADVHGQEQEMDFIDRQYFSHDYGPNVSEKIFVEEEEFMIKQKTNLSDFNKLSPYKQSSNQGKQTQNFGRPAADDSAEAENADSPVIGETGPRSTITISNRTKAKINATMDSLETQIKAVPENFIEEQYFATDRLDGLDEELLGRMNDRSITVNNPAESDVQSEDDQDDDVEKEFRMASSKAESDAKKVQIKQPPKSAYDFVMKLRSASKLSSVEEVARKVEFPSISGLSADDSDQEVKFKLDSKGFRTYKDQMPDLENEPEMFVLQLLKNSILYNDHDVVAISKPYGLQCHHGKGRRHKLTNFLPDLAKFVFRTDSASSSETQHKLYTIHRLDVDTTGVLLLAKTQEMAQTLHDLMAERKILKTYWALTKGVPSPVEGVVDIPMAEGMVDDKSRMVLRPDRTAETHSVIPKYTGKTQKAVTAYRVLASHGKAALVELKPLTGVKHQLRVHLAFALGCPIIGDHKYSHLSKLAPQRLSSDVLQRLHMRQSKVRHLPMHLHARGVVVPGVLDDGGDLRIGARLPKHFKDNMSKLNIQLKK